MGKLMSVICPVCAEVAELTSQKYVGLSYKGKVYCSHCKTLTNIITPPQVVDTITIKYEKPKIKGEQLEFDFVEDEIKIPGSDPK